MKEKRLKLKDFVLEKQVEFFKILKDENTLQPEEIEYYKGFLDALQMVDNICRSRNRY